MSKDYVEFCRSQYRLGASCVDEIWRSLPKDMREKMLSPIHRLHGALAPLNNMIPDHIAELDAALKAAQPQGAISDERIEQIYDETAGAMGDDYAHAGWLAFARALLAAAQEGK